MKERIEIQDVYTIKDCKANPNKYYVFGDNLIRKGYGGQAIIRDCHNAIGIPTKRYPGMEPKDFFSDKPDEFAAVYRFLNKLALFYIGSTKPIIVFPSAGIGTGYANLKEKSPEIYKVIDNFLIETFDINIQP